MAIHLTAVRATSRRQSHKMLRNYRCDVCGSKFTKASNLTRHRLVHSKEKPFECDVCALRFTQKSSLQRHGLLHSGERRFKCSKCSMRFTQRGNLQTHIRRVHPRNTDLTDKFPCPNCSCVFNKLNSLNRHSAKHHASKLSKETDEMDEDSAFENVMSQLKSLQNTMHQSFVNSSDNDFMFANDNINIPTAATNSISTENTEKDARKDCYVKIFETNTVTAGMSENYMKRTVEGVRKASYGCVVCSKQFARPYDLLRHNRVHTKEKPYECGICGRCFAIKSNLQVHLRIHGKDNDRITNCYQCPECFTQFSSLRQLDIHAKNHTESKLFCCKFCNKRFATTNNLRIHENLHRKKNRREFDTMTNLQEPIVKNTSTVLSENQDNRQFQCSICGLKFKRLAHLSQHELSHSGRKPYQCLTCKKSFTVRSSLNLHQKIHSGHKAKACDECDSKFRSDTELKRHKAVHSTARPFACPHCHKSFKTRGTCKAHIETHNNSLEEINKKVSRDDVTEYLNENIQNGLVSTTEFNDNFLETENVIYLDIDENICQSEIANEALQDPSSCLAHTQHFGSSSKFIEIDKLLQQNPGNSISTTITVQPVHVSSVSEMPSTSLVSVPEVPNERRHVCETCGRAFKKPIDLRRHTRIHTNEKPFECDVCKTSFRLKCTLETHQLVHEKNRAKFDCQVCGKTYASQNVLNVHIRIHTNERPYKCKYCNKTFRTTGHKDAHHRMHTKIPRKSSGQKRKLKKNGIERVEAIS